MRALYSIVLQLVSPDIMTNISHYAYHVKLNSNVTHYIMHSVHSLRAPLFFSSRQRLRAESVSKQSGVRSTRARVCFITI